MFFPLRCRRYEREGKTKSAFVLLFDGGQFPAAHSDTDHCIHSLFPLTCLPTSARRGGGMATSGTNRRKSTTSFHGAESRQGVLRMCHRRAGSRRSAAVRYLAGSPLKTYCEGAARQGIHDAGLRLLTTHRGAHRIPLSTGGARRLSMTLSTRSSTTVIRGISWIESSSSLRQSPRLAHVNLNLAASLGMTNTTC